MSERLIRLLRTRPDPAVGDAELLARWAADRDPAAFELLVRRHAEPVWRTCRAVAGEGAEDAFQATFLALARRAGAVRGNLPGWLWRVARHASLRAR
jgi:DNA-directed RNA polymerase specialized sigma24 family protein